MLIIMSLEGQHTGEATSVGDAYREHINIRMLFGLGARAHAIPANETTSGGRFFSSYLQVLFGRFRRATSGVFVPSDYKFHLKRVSVNGVGRYRLVLCLPPPRRNVGVRE